MQWHCLDFMYSYGHFLVTREIPNDKSGRSDETAILSFSVAFLGSCCSAIPNTTVYVDLGAPVLHTYESVTTYTVAARQPHQILDRQVVAPANVCSNPRTRPVNVKLPITNSHSFQ